MIEVRNVFKNYGEKQAVRDLSLRIEAGEVFAFLGPNGAGKTTTIKMLTGLVRPSSGSVSIGGFDLSTDSLHAKALMSYVPDEPYLYEKLSAREFMRLIGDLYAMPPEKIELRIEDMIELLDLGAFVDDLCESYSHGMKQRVVIASALLHEPKALIIDEPMVGLDPRSARTVKDLFRSLADEQHCAVFMSTHTLSVAEDVADRIGILHEGRLLELGSLEELQQRQFQAGSGNRRLEDLFLKLTEG